MTMMVLVMMLMRMLKSATIKTAANIPSTSCPLSAPAIARAVYSALSTDRQNRREIDPSDMMRLQFCRYFFNDATFDCITFIFPLRLQGFNFGPGEIMTNLQELPMRD